MYSGEMFIFLFLMLPFAVISKSNLPHAASSISMPICKVKEDCNNLWETPTISDCIDGLCHCTGGSSYSENKKTCECPENFVIGRSKCLAEQIILGGRCEEHIQCNSGTLGNLTVCDEKQCHCVIGSVSVNGVCRQKKYVSQPCEYDEECSHVGNFACLDKICTCKDEYVINPDDNSCMRVLQNMWDPCIHDLQCLVSFGEGAICRTKCNCKSKYESVGNVKCVKKESSGESDTSEDDDLAFAPPLNNDDDNDDECSSTSECNEEGKDTNSCVNGKCKKNGHSKVLSSMSVIFLMFLIACTLTGRNCCSFS